MKLLLTLICLVIPGWGNIQDKRYAVPIAFLLAPFLVLAITSWTRQIFEIHGIYFVIGSYFALQIYSAVMAWKGYNDRVSRNPFINISKYLLYPISFIGLLSITYMSKPIILGIQFYYIPSGSMLPTIAPGDIVIADTWIKIKNIQAGDIVIFQNPTISKIKIVKRVSAINSNMFMRVLGDNPRNSLDSRTLGLIDMKLIQARAQLKYSPNDKSILKISKLK